VAIAIVGHETSANLFGAAMIRLMTSVCARAELICCLSLSSRTPVLLSGSAAGRFYDVSIWWRVSAVADIPLRVEALRRGRRPLGGRLLRPVGHGPHRLDGGLIFVALPRIFRAASGTLAVSSTNAGFWPPSSSSTGVKFSAARSRDDLAKVGASGAEDEVEGKLE
jgi:hypothetical protein